MSELHHVVGDATRPIKTSDETVIIAHVVNDAGAWGRGFVMALSHEDDTPERWYRQWHAERHLPRYGHAPFELGQVQLAPFGPSVDDLWVANLVAQRGWRRGGDDPQALDLEALRTCLGSLRRGIEGSTRRSLRVVTPRLGCGLGGARWADVEPVLREELTDRGVNVTVYSLPGGRWDD